MDNKIIKFRVFDKKNKSLFPSFFSFSEDDQVYNGNYLDSNQFKYLFDNQPQYEIQQFTGLKDKNNREIFESDIVKTHNRFGKVFFHNDGYWAVNLDIVNNGLLSYYTKLDCEVVGNTFQNPELLINN